jgi:hypothetical protein
LIDFTKVTSNQKKELRFAALTIGMMECWNIGIMGEPGNEPALIGRHASVRPSRVRSSQPPGSVTTEVEQSTARRISESGEVKGVCPESATLAPRNKNFVAELSVISKIKTRGIL